MICPQTRMITMKIRFPLPIRLPPWCFHLILVITCCCCWHVNAQYGYSLPPPPPPKADASNDFYSLNGTNNNLQQPEWGSIFQPRVRTQTKGASWYVNGDHNVPFSDTNSRLPSACHVMSELFQKAPPRPDKMLNHLLLGFAHIVVWDIAAAAPKNTSEPLPIVCNGNSTSASTFSRQEIFCPVTGTTTTLGHGTTNNNFTIPLFRFAQHTNPPTTRNSINARTSFLDMSYMYGTNEEEHAAVRKFEGGLLDLDDEQGLPPYIERFNQLPDSYVMYVVFMRFHNYKAKDYAKDHPDWDDEKLFQMARHYTIAVYQSILEEKYIPTLLGVTLGPYQGYDPTVDPSIDEFFSAVSFRYPHSAYSSLVRMLDEDFQPIAADPILLRNVFKPPPPNDIRNLIIQNGGITPFLRGLATVPTKAVDASLVDDFNVWMAVSISSLDVQRSRDIGIPPYNQVRQAFGLPPMSSIDELAGKDRVVAETLKKLYHDDIDLVEAYVGALVESQLSEEYADFMGPLFAMSILEQFNRLRNGDRLYYKNRYTPEEYRAFPTLSEIILLVCDDMDFFPADTFTVYNHGASNMNNQVEQGATSTQLSLIGGDLSVGWLVEDGLDSGTGRVIDVTLTATEPMVGPGYLGVGWRSREMLGAEMWFCTVDDEAFNAATPLPSECENGANTVSSIFSCCLATGDLHVVPICSEPSETDDTDQVFYNLEIVDSCLSTSTSHVTIRAPVCANNDNTDNNNQTVDCFRLASTPDGRMDFIAAYNPGDKTRPHGYQRRTSAQVDLNTGILTASESNTSDEGLIATHAVFMLLGWMVLAPAAIFIVRYMKTKPWRLTAHISIIGGVGSLMVPLLIGVEASVGATDKTQQHSVVGLSIMSVYFVLAFAGRTRYLKLMEGRKFGRRADYISSLIHKKGGYLVVALSWWNCYTGLVRIGPEDSYFQVVLFGTTTLGYDIPVFGFIRKYIYGPWVAFVVLAFVYMEARRYYLNGSSHAQKMAEVANGASIWDDDDRVDENQLNQMTVETFLEETKLGRGLCVVDGRVLDISQFMDVHPGGNELLRFAAGSDITDEILGKRDVDGLKHVHSKSALRLMKRLVKAVLVDDNDMMMRRSFSGGRRSSRLSSIGRSSFAMQSRRRRVVADQFFRRARVVDVKYITPAIALTDTSHPVISLRLSVPSGSRGRDIRRTRLFPGSTFTFRGVEANGTATFERQYTPVHLDPNLDSNSNEDKNGLGSQDDVEFYDFIISLIPGGQMSKFLLQMKEGKLMLVQGPRVDRTTMQAVQKPEWKAVVMIAAGTGIAPILQLIDHYLDEPEDSSGVKRKSCPLMFVIWVLKWPSHNYRDALNIEKRVERSRGRLKWVVVYSSSVASVISKGLNRGKAFRGLGHPAKLIGSSSKNADTMSSKSRIGSYWSFKSIVDTERRRVLPTVKSRRKSVVRLLVESQSGNKGAISSSVNTTTDSLVFAPDWTEDSENELNTENHWSWDRRSVARQFDIFFLVDLLGSISEVMEDSHRNDQLGSKTFSVNNNDLIGDSSPMPQETAPGEQSKSNPITVADPYSGNDDYLEMPDNEEEEPTNKQEEASSQDNGIVVEPVADAFQDLLVAVSGSPAFEMDVTDWLDKMNFPSDQRIKFHHRSTIKDTLGFT